MQNDGSVSPIRAFFRNKWVRIILLANVVAIIVVIGIIINNATKTAIINLNIAPLDASVRIGGLEGRDNGSYQVHPGTYNITVSHDGLETKTLNLELKSGYSTTLTTFLKGEGDSFDFYTLRDNYGSFQKLAEIASAGSNITTDHDTSAEQFISDFKQQYNLYQTALPIVYSNYSNTKGYAALGTNVNISASHNNSCRKTLCIDAFSIGVDPNLTEQLLVESGFNLNMCEIRYEKV